MRLFKDLSYVYFLVRKFFLIKITTRVPVSDNKDEDDIRTLDFHQNLTHEKLLERFAMRKNNLVTECQNRSSGLEGVSMTENSIYYNDKYKIIACFPLKSGTTHWQTLMAILETDGKKTDFDDDHFEYGKSQSLRNLAKSIGRNLADLIS